MLALDRLQVELDQQPRRPIASQRRNLALREHSANRQAYIGLGQQISDVAIQAQMGTNAFMILGQQGSQLAFQLANTGGIAGRVAGFFAGLGERHCSARQPLPGFWQRRLRIMPTLRNSLRLVPMVE